MEHAGFERLHLTSTFHWIDVLALESIQIGEMKLKITIHDKPLREEALNFANCEVHNRLIIGAVENLFNSAKATKKDVRELLINLICNGTVGAFCELAAYDWLIQNSFGVKIQTALSVGEVLGKEGSVLDGQVSLLYNHAYFDVKSFGFNGQMAKRLKERLEELLLGKSVSIEDSWDVSIEEFQRLVEDVKSIAKQLKTKPILQFGRMNIRIHERQPVMISRRIVDPYLLAQENALYPFKYAHKFTRLTPFFLIFVAHPWFGQLDMNTDFAGIASCFTRSMARRAFMQFTNDKSSVSKICDQVAEGLSISEACSLLSGILFINVWPKGMDDGNNKLSPSWLYLNPRASNPLSRDQFDLIGASGMSQVTIDDFQFDNYPI